MRTLTCVDIQGKPHKVPVDQLSWLPGCYAVVVRDGRILLSNQHGAGRYVLPGGSAEFGEMPWQAVVRETFEETGACVTNPRLLTVKSNLFIMPGTNQPVQSLQLFYACDFAGGELSTDALDEHEKTWSGLPEWVPLARLDGLQNGSSFEWRDVVRKHVAAKRS